MVSVLLPMAGFSTPAAANTAEAAYVLVKAAGSSNYWMATADQRTGQKTNVVQIDTASLPAGATGKFNDLRGAGYSSATQKFYAFDYTTQYLFSITLQTGQIELVGKFLPSPGSGIKITAMAINDAGRAFAISEKSMLYQVILETAAIHSPKYLSKMRSVNSLTFAGNTLYGYAEIGDLYESSATSVGSLFRANWNAATAEFTIDLKRYSQTGMWYDSIPSSGIRWASATAPRELFTVALLSASTLRGGSVSELRSGDASIISFYTGVPLADQTIELVRGIYQPIAQTVSFDSQGGTAVPAIYGVSGQDLSEPVQPTKASQDFEGWFTAPSGGTRVTWPYAFSSSTTLYAQWNSTPATLSFNSYGGTVVNDIPGYVGQEIPEPVQPTKAGSPSLGFDGWYTAESGGTQISWPYTLLANTTLHAQWSSTPATITFNRDTTLVGTLDSYVGVEINQPAVPTWAGKNFYGWWTSHFGGSRVNWPLTLTGSVTLYERWTVSLSYDSQGGTPVLPRIDVTPDTLSYLPEPPSYSFKTFTGWFDAETGGNAISWPMTLSSNTTLYARWAPIASTISFDSHGGTPVGSISSATGELVEEPSEPTKSNAGLEGWFTSASGGTKIEWPYLLAEVNPTLHAQWNTVPATLTFDSLGGTPVASISSFLGEELSPPPPPTKLGRTFLGWHTEASEGVEVLWPYELMANSTLYARWAVDATITFDSQGGSSIEPWSGLEGDLLPEPPAPTRSGYAFTSWSTGTISQVPVSWPHSVVESKTFFATWQANGSELADTGLSDEQSYFTPWLAVLLVTLGSGLIFVRRRR
jgi:uncharacterized repeat protein (TIGR02543 family)